ESNHKLQWLSNYYDQSGDAENVNYKEVDLKCTKLSFVFSGFSPWKQILQLKI
ncbi:unnamed protein product, partial [Rotaria magnacalcarata]